MFFSCRERNSWRHGRDSDCLHRVSEGSSWQQGRENNFLIASMDEGLGDNQLADVFDHEFDSVRRLQAHRRHLVEWSVTEHRCVEFFR